MFAVYVMLVIFYRATVLWLPDPNHKFANVSKNIFGACGLEHIRPKLRFMANFDHAPSQKNKPGTGGRWHNMIAGAWSKFKPLLLDRGTPEARDFENDWLPVLAAELGLGFTSSAQASPSIAMLLLLAGAWYGAVYTRGIGSRGAAGGRAYAQCTASRAQ
jgi:hypothetical protein